MHGFHNIVCPNQIATLSAIEPHGPSYIVYESWHGQPRAMLGKLRLAVCEKRFAIKYICVANQMQIHTKIFEHMHCVCIDSPCCDDIHDGEKSNLVIQNSCYYEKHASPRQPLSQPANKVPASTASESTTNQQSIIHSASQQSTTQGHHE